MFHDLTSNYPGKIENLKLQGPLRVSSTFFSEAAPKIFLEISCSKISRNSVESTRGGFLFSFQGTDLLIYRNWVAQFWRNYFLEYLRLIALPKSSHRSQIHRKAPVLESLFNKVVGLRLQYRCFLVNIRKFLSAFVLKNICERLLLYTSLVSSTIISWIHTELLLHVQPS